METLDKDLEPKLQDEHTIWDDKFGLLTRTIDDKEGIFKQMESDCKKAEGDCKSYCKKCENEPPAEAISAGKKYVKGVSKDAEITTNSKGGKQSKSAYAFYLIEPKYLERVFKDICERCEYEDEGESIYVEENQRDLWHCCKALEHISDYMSCSVDIHLSTAMDYLEDDDLKQLLTIAEVLKTGTDRYEPNNWRLIGQEEHLNHAIVHIMAHLQGDNQDDHIAHALCRLYMAQMTEPSEGFSYNYVKDEQDVV